MALPALVAQDLDRLARFDREARTLAALNHPNIAAIHGLEHADGTQALVMELVEGRRLPNGSRNAGNLGHAGYPGYLGAGDNPPVGVLSTGGGNP